MLASLKVIAPAASPVIDTATMAAHARIDGDGDLLALYREAATALVEKHLNRALITQTLKWTVADTRRDVAAYAHALAPGSASLPLNVESALRRSAGPVVELPYGPVQAVTQVAVGEWGEADDPLAEGADYAVDLAHDPARVRLDPGYAWGSYNRLSVTYTAGYGGMGSVPAPIVAAVLLTATSLYEHRGDDDAVPGLGQAARALLSPYRVAWFA